jgi:quinoprotein glucose dehydrogenase
VVYAVSCASCHGLHRRGNDRAPSLVDVGARLSAEQIQEVLERGRGFMPSFANLPESEKTAVIAHLLGMRRAPSSTTHAEELAASRVKRTTSPYEFVGYERWRDSSGLPAVKPPWGTLTAIDLNTGAHRWRIPLGEHPALNLKGVPGTGTEQYGGPIVTAGGVVFIAATQDAKFRAFDKTTGTLLWETTLPAPGYATPSTYRVRGKQYVVIAAGGGKLGTRSDDVYVAFALPE